MYRRYYPALIFLSLTACATSGPEHETAVASADDRVPNSAPTTATGNVEVAEVPEVPKVTDIPVRDEVVCTRERRTGTNRVEKVCRSRSSINRTATEAKETFEILRRSQVEY